MSKAWLSKRRELLPWYVNGTLTASERSAEERWLRQSTVAQAELAGWQQLYAAMASQSQQIPSPAVRQRVRAQVRATILPRPQTRVAIALAWAWGGVLTAAILLLLWCAIQPGIVLQWSANDGPLSAFRVYRASLGSDDFALLYEPPARPGAQRYTYVDAYLWPGQTFVYRVEGVRLGGQSAFSQAVTASSLDALPGQLAILLTSLIAGYGATMSVQRRLVTRRI